jgi:hypothetical protein
VYFLCGLRVLLTNQRDQKARLHGRAFCLLGSEICGHAIRPVLGPGVIFRVIRAVQKKHFDAPDLRVAVGKYD